MSLSSLENRGRSPSAGRWVAGVVRKIVWGLATGVRAAVSAAVGTAVGAAAVAAIVVAAGGTARADLSVCIDATCRITAPDGARGTGCVFELSQGRVYVLTCHHVVGGSAEVVCEFWHRGHQSAALGARVAARNPEADAAVVVLDAAQFDGRLPPAVPLAPRGRCIAAGEPLVSVGCAGGRWATAWRGHALGDDGGELRFVPPPADGRSGSAVFDAEGTMIVGLLRARSGDDQYGIATASDELYRAMGTAGWARDSAADAIASQRAADAATQCPGGQCPAPRNYLLPYRYREQFRDPIYPSPVAPFSPTWPTLPPSLPPAAPGATVDLEATHERLDRITELLERIENRGRAVDGSASNQVAPRGDAASPGPGAIAPEATPPGAMAALRGDLETAKAETSKLRAAVEALVGDRDTLDERIAARVEKVKGELGPEAGMGQIVRAYVRDFAAEKLNSGEMGWTLGKILGGALGLSGPLAFALGGGLWVLARRLGKRID
mgnify:CR=1 FL=1